MAKKQRKTLSRKQFKKIGWLLEPYRVEHGKSFRLCLFADHRRTIGRDPASFEPVAPAVFVVLVALYAVGQVGVVLIHRGIVANWA